MDQDALRTLLARVHDELEQGEPVDGETRELLRTVLGDITSAIERPPETPSAPEHQSLAGRLKDATWRVESSHPRLTSVVSELVDDLTRIFQ